MTRKGKAYKGTRRDARSGHGPLPLRNNYATLEHDDGTINTHTSRDMEMNAQLSERFGAATIHDNSLPSSARDAPAGKPTQAVRKYFEDFEQPNFGQAWLEQPETPSTAEILHKASYEDGEVSLPEDLRPNKVEGAYASNEDYLETQYNLLRQDATLPLRQAVARVRASPYDKDEADYGGDVGVYEPVYIKAMVFSFRGLATRVAFSMARAKKRIRWGQSKRLITGSLVALSPVDDAFQTKCILATVAARTLTALDQNPPEIDLFFDRPEDMEIDPMIKWIMIEDRTSFFEASRHTLRALQHMMHEPFPLSEHIVKTEKTTNPPAYLQKNPFVDMSSIVAIEDQDAFINVNVLNDWPAHHTHGLDASQSSALKRILTQRLAIVQGPPGTGKTYVSVVALKVLLANLQPGDPPIIVTCQTNHALDQLLRHVAEFEPNFIRLGGRSQDKDKIKKRTLFEVRNSTSQPWIQGGTKSQAIKNLRRLTEDMQKLLSPLEANNPPLDHRLLFKLGLLTQEQCESLESMCVMGMSLDAVGMRMEQWLGRCMVPCLHPVQPDDFEKLPYEEEDFGEEQLLELEAEANAKDDDDIEALKGPHMLLCDNVAGRGQSLNDEQIRTLLAQKDDLTTIPTDVRGAVYNYFKRQTKRLLLREFRRMAARYKTLVRERQIGQWEASDYNVLREQRLIGMTTTGLSKYRPLIACLNPKVILVEEAAETLETPVTAACLPTVEHLILVGDHQQLRPHCHVRELEENPYNFNLSLFERMVNNGIDIDCLKRQRRMIPEIRDLLRPIYGSALRDHPSVKEASNRPPVEGMGGCNSYFFTHEWPESRDANMSCLNEKEADMVVGLYNYLYLNGVDPSKITILTFYHGQRKAILKRIVQHQNFRGHCMSSVVTVDSYQGEENDIVLLSLVRSNPRYQIGFLNVDNRVCVALSRAKRGSYIFGNAEILASESATWAEVVESMYGRKGSLRGVRRLGYCLPLTCSNHNYKTYIEDPDDWEEINGGCDEVCRCTLPCGHMCMLRCHPFDAAQTTCTQKCSKHVELCGHPCTALCCDPCRCGFCERHNPDGSRALLRPSKGSRAPKQGHARPSALSTAPESSTIRAAKTLDGRLSEWEAYSVGGAREDDAAFRQKIAEQQLEYKKARSVMYATPTSGNTGPPTPRTNTLRSGEEALVEFVDDFNSRSQVTVTAMDESRLIDISPTKPPPGNNENLLLDFAPDAEHVDFKNATVSAAAAPLASGVFPPLGQSTSSKSKTTDVTDLLD